jgi:hypothetical protein
VPANSDGVCFNVTTPTEHTALLTMFTRNELFTNNVALRRICEPKCEVSGGRENLYETQNLLVVGSLFYGAFQ